MKLIEKIEGEQIKKQTSFNVGDTVKVHTRVKAGDKERTQVFAGIVIGHKGRGLNESFTVRRISYGEGVERVFPVNSPRIEKIEVEREGKVRRAKLFYLRGQEGKVRRQARRPGRKRKSLGGLVPGGTGSCPSVSSMRRSMAVALFGPSF
jgi:large subunit ribosomal protein L19